MMNVARYNGWEPKGRRKSPGTMKGSLKEGEND